MFQFLSKFREITTSFFFIPLFFCFSCSTDSPQKHYILAEKLWMDRNYKASVSEFEKVFQKDSHGKLGLRALYRSAMTQAFFLYEYEGAIKKLKVFIQESSDLKDTLEAQLQIGDILFSHFNQYDQSLFHYQSLLKLYPDCSEVPQLYYRIGKSQFFLFLFKESIESYQKIIQKFPGSIWCEKASFEIGTSYFAMAGRTGQSSHGTSDYQRAIEAYRKFIKSYPKSTLKLEAYFGIASCFEELNQLEESLEIYNALKDEYPIPKIIEIKLFRIQERMAQKKASLKTL